MKRIIIPAGAISGEKDYILEIPVELNDVEEDSIYVLDGKSSKESSNSLSDYFYEEKEETNTYIDRPQSRLDQSEYLSKSPQFLPVHNPPSSSKPINECSVPDHSSINSSASARIPSNRKIPQSSNDYIDSKYRYFKSLGFSEPEIKALLFKKGEPSISPRISRKFMKFNRLGVRDFFKSEEGAKDNEVDYRANPNDSSLNTAKVETHDGSLDTASTSKSSKTFQQNSSITLPKNKREATFTKTIPVLYDPSYVVRPQYGSYNTSSKPNSTLRQTSASSHASANLTTPRKIVYPPSRNYTRYPSVNSAPPLQRSPIYSSKPNSQNYNVNSDQYVESRAFQQNVDLEDETYSDEEELVQYEMNYGGLQRETFRTLPGTSVVSNSPNIKMSRVDY